MTVSIELAREDENADEKHAGGRKLKPLPEESGNSECQPDDGRP
jgi:hypothetical protein